MHHQYDWIQSERILNGPKKTTPTPLIIMTLESELKTILKYTISYKYLNMLFKFMLCLAVRNHYNINNLKNDLLNKKT